MRDVQDVVRAKAFELIGPDGRVTATLAYGTGDAPGPVFALGGPAADRIIIAVKGDKAEIEVRSTGGRVISALTVRENNNGTQLLMRDLQSNVKIAMGVDAKGSPFFKIVDKDGQALCEIPPEQRRT
jgi:hypothetical protein